MSDYPGEYPVSAIIDIEDCCGTSYANTYKQCTCSKCAKLCTFIPGIYDPDHLYQMLQTGVITKQWIMDKLILDFWVGVESPIIYLRPKTINENPGHSNVTIPDTGPCINLTPTGCALNRSQMPIGCISTYACGSDKPSWGKLKGSGYWNGCKGSVLVKLYTNWCKEYGIETGVDIINEELYNPKYDVNYIKDTLKNTHYDVGVAAKLLKNIELIFN